MAATINTESAPACETARRRLLSIKGDPFLIATWERAFFLHLVVEPEVLRAEVPNPFALERYTGYYYRGTQGRLFRAWHPPWQQAPIQPTIQDASLISNRFPWFSEAKFSAANFSPGFSEVWLGRPHRLGKCHPAPKQARPVLSAFYKMP